MQDCRYCAAVDISGAPVSNGNVAGDPAADLGRSVSVVMQAVGLGVVEKPTGRFRFSQLDPGDADKVGL